MSLEENKAIVRSLFEALNKQNLAVLDKLIAPDYVDRTNKLRGREVFKQFYTMLRKSFPDFHVTVEGIIAEGDTVWGRLEATGTHTGEYRLPATVIGKKITLAPTGNKFTLTAVSIWSIVDGKIAERETVYDFLDFLKQLGVIEYKGFPDENVS